MNAFTMDEQKTSLQLLLGICWGDDMLKTLFSPELIRPMSMLCLQCCVWMATQENDAYAQYVLGQCYAHGLLHVMPPNMDLALSWVENAARQNCLEAQLYLCKMYHKTNDKMIDASLGFYWRMKAAENEHAKSQYKVAKAYDLGIGINQNATLAIAWYVRAAKCGSIDAMYVISHIFDVGRENVQLATDKQGAAIALQAATNVDRCGKYRLRFERFVEKYNYIQTLKKTTISEEEDQVNSWFV